MAVITHRVGLGRNLTAAEVDANFDGLNDELATKANDDVFTSGAAGLVPASGGGSSTYLCADGTFNTPPGAGDMVLDSVQTVTGQKTFGTGVLVAVSPSITTPTGIVKGDVGLGNVDNTSDLNKPVSTAATAALALKAPLASPTFTGTVSGITATMVGLGNVNNTSDANKPVSTATQTALDLKANLASPALTGTPTAPTAAAATNTTQVATTAHVFAERTNAATLTNKTLTSPTINTPTIATPSISNPTMTGTVVVPDASFSLAKIASIATDSFIGRDTAGTGAPEVLSIATVQAMLGIGAGSGQVTIYGLDGANEAARKPTIAVSQSLARAGTFRLTGGFPTRGVGMLVWAAQKVTGGAGTASVRVHMDATGVALGAGNDIHGTVALSTSANGGAQGCVFFYGNGTDQTSVRVQTPLNQTNPFQTLLTASVFTQTVNTNQDLDVALSLTTDATDTAKIVDAFLVVFDPDASAGGGGGTWGSITGTLTDQTDLTAYVRPSIDTETSGRALVAADVRIGYNSASTGTFTLGTSAGIDECVFMQLGAGAIDISVASGVTVNGAAGPFTLSMTNTQYARGVLTRLPSIGADTYMV